MKLSPGEQEQITQLLTRIHHDIRDLEMEFELMVGGGDFRPRIEYFHDAIRAFSQGDAREREEGGRLSVEFLAYDIGCLRYLHAMPLSPFTPHAANLSPGTDIIKLDQHLAPMKKKPDRVTKERLAELYQRYAMLFASLLKPYADADYHDRIDDLYHDVEAMNAIIEKCDKGQAATENLEALVAGLEDGELKQELEAFLHKKKYKSTDEIRKLVQKLRDRIGKKGQSISAIEKAHMEYALAQLAIYEGARDIIKKLAGQGMNLVGKFVEASIKETRREIGR